jgi:hypothetical protein
MNNGEGVYEKEVRGVLEYEVAGCVPWLKMDGLLIVYKHRKVSDDVSDVRLVKKRKRIRGGRRCLQELDQPSLVACYRENLPVVLLVLLELPRRWYLYR